MLERKYFIVDVILQAKDIIKQRINEDFKISIKNNNHSDLVTAVDVEIEKFLVKKISQRFPNDAFLTEEKTTTMEESDYLWIIDPIDGTMNFVYTLKDFAISIALYYKGVGMIGIVYDIMADEMFVGVKGEGVYLNNKKLDKVDYVHLNESIVDVSLKTIMNMHKNQIADLNNLPKYALSHRNLGSAALRICHIATNRIHVYLSDTLCIWDIAAGIIILEELGGYHNFIKDDQLQFKSNHFYFFAANNEELAHELVNQFYY